MKTKKKLLVLICALLATVLLCTATVVVVAELGSNNTETVVAKGDKGVVDGTNVAWPDKQIDVEKGLDFITLRDLYTDDIGSSYGAMAFFNVGEPEGDRHDTTKSFNYSTVYGKSGNANTIRIDYSNLDSFIYNKDGALVINVTPVVRKMVKTTTVERLDVITHFDGFYEGYNHYSYPLKDSQVLTVQYQTVKTLTVVHDMDEDTYYTEFSYKEGELEQGYYNISFILTYLTPAGEHSATVIDGWFQTANWDYQYQLPSKSEANSNNFTLNVAYLHEATVYTTFQKTDSAPYENANRSAIAYSTPVYGSVPFATGESQDYKLFMADYEYGSFDASDLTYIYHKESAKQLFDTDYKKDGVISLDALQFTLYRIYADGTRIAVYNPAKDTKCTLNTIFYTATIFNDLIAGNYEIQVYFNGTDACEASVAKAQFSVLPKTVNEGSRDIYAATGIYLGVDLSDETYRYNTAILADYLAYYKAYSAIAKAEDQKALYELLLTEYKKVYVAYADAMTAYNNFFRAENTDKQKYSYLLTEYYALNLLSDKYNGWTTFEYNGLNIQAYQALLIGNEVGSDAEKTEVIAESLLEKAFKAYEEYVNQYNAYVAFCKTKGITISPMENSYAEYKEMVYRTIMENMEWSETAQAWVPNSTILNSKPLLAFEPEALPGLCAPGTLEKSFTGAGQFPNLLLWQYVDGTSYRGTNLRNMYSEEALLADIDKTTSYETKIGRLTNPEIVYDYGHSRFAYVAYRVLDKEGNLITATAVHGGTYAFSVEFEGNYKGCFKGLSFTITPATLSVGETQITVTKTYNGKAFSEFYNAIGSIEEIIYGGKLISFRNCDRGTVLALDKNLADVSQVTMMMSTSKQNRTEGLEGFISDAPQLVHTIQKYDETTKKWVAVSEAKDVGEYRIVYTLSATDALDYCFMNQDDKPVKEFVQTLTIEKLWLNPDITVAGVQHGDTVSDVTGKILSYILNSFDGNAQNYVNFDLSNAYLWDANKKVLPATTKVVAGETYALVVPVTLKDATNTLFGTSVWEFVDEKTDAKTYAVSSVFTVSKKMVSADWTGSKWEADYNGLTHIADLKACFTDVDGKQIPLVIAVEDNLIHAGDHQVYAAISDGEAYYTLDNSLGIYTINPVVLTPSVKEVVYPREDATSLVYAEGVWDLEFNYEVNGLVDPEDMQYLTFGFPKFVANEYEGGYIYFVEDDYRYIPVGDIKTFIEVSCSNTDYVLDTELLETIVVIEPLDLTDYELSKPYQEDHIFNGEEHALDLSVLMSEELPWIIEDRDFTVAYSNNINAGEASYVITFKGNYKGSQSGSFTIDKLEVELADTDLTFASPITYTGSELTPLTKIVVNGLEFRDVDATLTYANNINAGTASVTIAETEESNFTFEAYTAEFTIDAKTFDGTITLDNNTFTYSGSAHTPVATVKDGEVVLALDTDYTVAYDANVNAGTAKVTVTFQGNYTGENDVEFTINKLAYTASELAVYTWRAGDNKITKNNAKNRYEVICDGDTHMLYLDGSIEGVTFTYEKDGFIASGLYTVKAIFTVDDNHADIAPMTAILDIKAKTIEKVAEPTDPEKQGQQTEQKLPDIIVEYEEGFSASITVKVSVVAAKEITDKASTLQLMIDYKDQLGRNEAISRLYEVKLIEVSDDGTEREIKVEDLGNGATIKVKMMVPEDLVNTDKLTRILHVHDASDITELTRVDTEAELAVGKYYIDEEGYLVTIIDRLSEFAFIYEKDCFAHWILLGEMVLFIAFIAICWFVLKKRKHDLMTIIGCSVYFVAFVVTAIFGHCAACVVLVILSALLLIAAVALYLHIWDIARKLLKKLKHEEVEEEAPAPEAETAPSPALEKMKEFFAKIKEFFVNLFKKKELAPVAAPAPQKVVRPKMTEEEKEAKEEAELEAQFEKLVAVQPAPESFEGEGKVETVGVCLAGRKKVYRFAPNGVSYNVGDKVIADTVNGMTRGMIVHANYFVNPEELVAELKNVTPKKSNNNQ